MIKVDTKKNLHKKRNQTLNTAKVKNMTYDEAYDLKSEHAKNAVACDFVIDCNKRRGLNDEPRMKD